MKPNALAVILWVLTILGMVVTTSIITTKLDKVVEAASSAAKTEIITKEVSTQQTRDLEDKVIVNHSLYMKELESLNQKLAALTAVKTAPIKKVIKRKVKRYRACKV